jgi:hypothetical protein
MKIFYVKETSSAAKTVVVTGTTVKFVTDNSKEQILTIPTPNVTPDFALLYKTPYDGLQLAWDSERFNSRDAGSHLADRKGITDLNKPVAIFGFTDKTTILVFLEPCNEIEGGTAVDQSTVKEPRQFLASQDPQLRVLAQRYKAKRKLLAHINTADSLAALEMQVDILTGLVLSLARKQPTNEQPSWLEELEAVFNDTTSVSENALKEAVKSTGAYKARIRALQEEYFRDRSINK